MHHLSRTPLSWWVTLALTGTLVGCSSQSQLSMAQQDQQKIQQQARQQAVHIVAKMPLKAKIKLLTGPGFSMTSFVALKPDHLRGDVTGIAGYINGVHLSTQDIPPIKLADGPAGVRLSPTRPNDSHHYYATAWPVGTLLASSWDAALMRTVGHTFGQEVKSLGIDFLLAPGMNIQRNPLNGRNFEYYSEDPLLSGAMGAAFVKGLQSNGVGATIKHFVANNSESNRMHVDEIITPRALREIYMRSYKIAIQNAQPWAVMTSYNKVNGTYTNERRDMLTTILRGEWGFKGFVMTDWFAGDLKHPEHIINAGNDNIQPGGDQIRQRLYQAYKQGQLSQQTIDTSATRILTQVLKTPTYHKYPYLGTVEHPQQDAQLSRKAAAQSMILLKNDAQTLPIQPQQSIASFGVGQVNTFKGGSGSGDVNTQHIVSIAQGLAQRFLVNTQLQKFYTDYFAQHKKVHKGPLGDIGNNKIYRSNEPLLSQAQIDTYAQHNDIAVITIARMAGEGGDRSVKAGDYLLSDAERTLIDRVSHAFHAQQKKVVVVLNIAGVMDTQWAKKVDSVLLAYMPGQEAGLAVADVLSGDVNPSGKLTQTFPRSYQDVPSAQNFPGQDTNGDGKVDRNLYHDGIYVGYRFYTTYQKPVAYPFGYGLSYTTFRYQDRQLVNNTLNSHQAHGQVTVQATIENVGARMGREVAEVYVHTPNHTLIHPKIELKAFAKTKSLAPKGREQLTFTIDAKTLASFDPKAHEWIVEPGQYRVYIAPSSRVKRIPPVYFNVDHKIVVSQTNAHTLSLPKGISADSLVTLKKS